jgi:hypothetical protein
MKENCELAQNLELRNACIAGVVSGLGGRFIHSPSQMVVFCAIVNEENKDVCYGTLGEIVSQWGYDEIGKHSVCASIDDKEFINVCRRTGFREQNTETQSMISVLPR